MRSRIAILFMLVSGFALSGAGAGLAVSGVVGDNPPVDAQYAVPGGEQTLVPAAPAPEQGVAGEQNSRAPAPEKSTPPAKVAPVEQAEPTQVTRQVAANTTAAGTLPFTGFAAIPVLLIGVFLLASGFVLRRSNRRAEA